MVALIASVLALLLFTNVFSFLAGAVSCEEPFGLQTRYSLERIHTDDTGATARNIRCC